ncbi:MAG: putative signal peptide peptidase SppA, partial [Pseudomonadota bacterium]
ASALLWAICPAARIDASATALVGSIGVVRTVEDTSARDAKNGRKTIVLRSGALKAPGQPGEAWTDAQIADAQAIIDGMGAMFAADLAAGRHLNPVQMAAITDGRVHLAADAQRLGLIDSVRSFDESLADFVHAASFPQRRSAPAASTPSTTGNQTMKIAPDRLAALVKDHQSKAVLITSMAAGSATAEPSTEADIVAALAAEASKDLAVQVTTLEAQLVAAKAAHAADVTALKAQLAEATAKAAIDTPKGVKALDGSAPPAPIAADPVAAYHAKLAELKASGDPKPSDTIARKFAAINQAYISAVNAKHKES